MLFLDYEVEKNKKEINAIKTNLFHIIRRDDNFTNGQYEKEINHIVKMLNANNVDWQNMVFTIGYNHEYSSIFKEACLKAKIILSKTKNFDPSKIFNLEGTNNAFWHDLVLDYLEELHNLSFHEDKKIDPNYLSILIKIINKIDKNQTNTKGESILHLLLKRSYKDSEAYFKIEKIIDSFLYETDLNIRDDNQKLFLSNIKISSRNEFLVNKMINIILERKDIKFEKLELENIFLNNFPKNPEQKKHSKTNFSNLKFITEILEKMIDKKYYFDPILFKELKKSANKIQSAHGGIFSTDFDDLILKNKIIYEMELLKNKNNVKLSSKTKML